MPQPDPTDPDPDRPRAAEPGRDARLRRLLADARHSDPVPSDVAARLDRVLEGLAGEERDAETPAVAVLAARRRRRTVQILVAAVAVVVVGVGLNAVVGDDGDEAADSSSSAADSSAAEAEALSEEAAPPDDSAGGQSAQDSESAPGSPGSPSSLLTEPPVQAEGRTAFRVSEDRFVRDVRRLRAATGAVVIDADQEVAEAGLGGGPGFVCGQASYGAGTLLPVRYDGGAAVLAYRVPRGESQAVDLLQCGSAQLLRSTTVPVRR